MAENGKNRLAIFTIFRFRRTDVKNRTKSCGARCACATAFSSIF